MPRPSIDRERLRVFVRGLDGADLLVLLDRAIDLLPASKLPALIRDYARPADLRPDGSEAQGLLKATERFHRESLEGRYYEDFMVNSKKYRQMSKGTQRWIAECQRLLDLSVEASGPEHPQDARAALELIFDLLLRIDDGNHEFVFFADEAGSWQVGVDWRRVMPAWFRCLAPSAPPDEYAEKVHSMVSYYAHWEADKILPAARRWASADQKAALDRLPAPAQTYKQPVLRVRP